MFHQILFTPDESSLEGGPTVVEGGGGGLGEEMFRYSSAFVLARRTGQRACVPKVHSHNGVVNGAVKIDNGYWQGFFQNWQTLSDFFSLCSRRRTASRGSSPTSACQRWRTKVAQ